ncbi:CbiQ family ECF transporter T component, partial [Arthrospira platensis SPKY1]|nr:CbiQ family ECF transporter T component [Arthrospira platensis SPKY1]
MHGGLLIFLWLGAVALMQRLPPQWLAWLILLLGVACMLFARERAIRLVRRVRVLLLAIVVLFAWFTPGTRVMVDLPSLSPTLEGLMLAFEHAGRVIVVVLCVALLMQHLSAARLVGALYALLRPFERVGLPAGRIAVRTLLVLEFVEGKGAASWKKWLTPSDVETALTPVHMPVEPFQGRDWVTLALGLTILV